MTPAAPLPLAPSQPAASRALRGAAIGALAAGGTTLAVQCMAQPLLPHRSTAPPWVQLALEASLLLSLGAGVAVATRTAWKATAGSHTYLMAARDAARRAGKIQGAFLGAWTAFHAAAAPLGAPAGIAIGIGGALLGGRVGAATATAITSLYAAWAKRDAGLASSRFYGAAVGPAEHQLTPQNNRISPLIDDTAMIADVMKEVSGARKSILLETFLFNGPDAKALSDLLIRKRREGLEVKVLLDPASQWREAVHKRGDVNYNLGRYLKNHDIEYAAYPLDKLTGSLTPAQHAKLLIVDDAVAYVGGTNIDDSDNHDMNVKIAGPAARDLRQFFDESWGVATHPDPHVLGLEHDPPMAAANLRMYSTSPSRSTIKQAVLDNIHSARNSITVAMFTLTDATIVDALKDAKQRGLDVKVLLCDNRRIFHVPTFHMPNLPTALELAAAGLDVRWYHNDQFPQMHSKMAVFDHRKVMLGSANWIHNAFRGIHEYAIDIEDESLARQFESQFDSDWHAWGTAVTEAGAGPKAAAAVVRKAAPLLV